MEMIDNVENKDIVLAIVNSIQDKDFRFSEIEINITIKGGVHHRVVAGITEIRRKKEEITLLGHPKEIIITSVGRTNN